MIVEILYIADCPHFAAASNLVEQVLAEAGVNGAVKAVQVRSEQARTIHGFAGSPTILVNGRDVEPAPATGFACRIYSNGKGCPSREVIRRAVERARAEAAER